jgi:hypothetical protein
MASTYVVINRFQMKMLDLIIKDLHGTNLKEKSIKDFQDILALEYSVTASTKKMK